MEPTRASGVKKVMSLHRNYGLRHWIRAMSTRCERPSPETGSFFFEGVFVNYRYPGPKRVWKGGSEPHSHPAFSDESDENQDIYENHVNSRKLILEKSSHTLDTVSRKMNLHELDVLDPSRTFVVMGCTFVVVGCTFLVIGRTFVVIGSTP